MSNSLFALLGYSLWTLLLLIGIAILRVRTTVAGVRPPNGFAVWGDDVSPFSGRLCRAHANCYENLPAFAAIVLIAQISGNASVTDPTALWVLAARLAQSTVHLASTRNRAVTWRFGFQLVQIAIQVWWAVELLLLMHANALVRG